MEITILIMAGSGDLVFEGIATGFANRVMVTGNRDSNFGLYDVDTAYKERYTVKNSKAFCQFDLERFRCSLC
jgi:hypothetical protein